MSACSLFAAALIVPAVASADMTIGVTNTGVTTGTCSWTATAANATVAASVLDTCLAGSGATLTDGLAPITFGGTGFTDSTCASTLTLDDTQSGGGVEINEPVDLSGNSSCELKTTVVGDVTEGASGSLTVPTLYLDGTGSVGSGGLGAGLASADNEIGTTYGTLGGNFTLDDNVALAIDQLSGSQQVLVEDSGGIDVQGKITGSQVGLDGGDGSSLAGPVNESAAASIDAPLLMVDGSTIDLPGTNNEVGAIVASTALTGLTFNDFETSGLTAAQVVSDIGNVTITNTGSVELRDAIGGVSVSVSSSSGSINESDQSGSTIVGNSVTANAPNGEVYLSGADVSNDYASLGGTAGSGGFTAADDDTDPLALDAVSSSGVVDVDSVGSQLKVTGQVSGAAIELGGDGLSGAGGSLAAPSVDLGSSKTGDTWTLGPGSVSDGSGLPIPFSGASSLAVNATGTYNVTASPTTAFTVTGGTPPASTLNYDAQGRTVTGTTSAPTGVIDSPTVQPVNFTNMKTVNLSAVGTAPVAAPASTSTSTSASTVTSAGAVTAGAPACTLTAPRSVVTTPKARRGHHKSRTPATLRLRVSCQESAALSLTGKVTVAAAGKHHHSATTYSISAVRGSLASPGSKTLVVDIPAAVVKALSAHSRKTASFTLEATGAGGSGTVSLAISRLT